MTHPNEALFEGEKPFPVISACEHFAGSEKLILKAMDLQKEYGPVFDITCDCEDGAQAGQERGSLGAAGAGNCPARGALALGPGPLGP